MQSYSSVASLLSLNHYPKSVTHAQQLATLMTSTNTQIGYTPWVQRCNYKLQSYSTMHHPRVTIFPNSILSRKNSIIWMKFSFSRRLEPPPFNESRQSCYDLAFMLVSRNTCGCGLILENRTKTLHTGVKEGLFFRVIYHYWSIRTGFGSHQVFSCCHS